MSRENSIGQVRPITTFEGYKPKTPEQRRAHKAILQVANQLIVNQEWVVNERYPFNYARWIMLWGQPGTGKTHLLEALINKMQAEAPAVTSRIHLARTNFTHDNMTFGEDYGHNPIVLFDDMYGQHHSIDELHPRTDIAAMVNFVRKTYEERRLVISTCNFPLKGEILEKVKDVDETGRVVSRLEELLAASGEMEVKGPDYRRTLARQRGKNPFDLF